MATIRHYQAMPATANRDPAKRAGRRPKPARERKALSVTVNFTATEYDALTKYRELKLQPSDAGAIRAALILELRALGLLD